MHSLAPAAPFASPPSSSSLLLPPTFPTYTTVSRPFVPVLDPELPDEMGRFARARNAIKSFSHGRPHRAASLRSAPRRVAPRAQINMREGSEFLTRLHSDPSSSAVSTAATITIRARASRASFLAITPCNMKSAAASLSFSRSSFFPAFFSFSVSLSQVFLALARLPHSRTEIISLT